MKACSRCKKLHVGKFKHCEECLIKARVIAKRQRVYNWSEKDEEYQRKWRLENQDKIKGYRKKYRQGMIIKALAMGLTPWKYSKMRGWENYRLKRKTRILTKIKSDRTTRRSKCGT